MKVDWYLKAVLTVISVCLTFICLKDLNLIRLAQAQDQPKAPQEVIIAGWEEWVSNGIGKPDTYNTFQFRETNYSVGMPTRVINDYINCRGSGTSPEKK